MRSVTQKHSYGCGVACVAFIAGVSYQTAIRLLGSRNAANEGFWCVDLAKGLKKLGKNYEYKYIKPDLKHGIYRDGVIVFIKRSKRYPAGHYLAWYKGKWMDPWINFPSEMKSAKSGFRNRLPGQLIYALFPNN